MEKFETKIIKTSISLEIVKKMAREQFGDLVKAVVDIKQEIMALGGELHADEEVLLIEKEGSKREDTWGINLYPEQSDDEFIEFDSMVNLKPSFGNRSRGVEDPEVRKKIKKVIDKRIARV